MIRVLLYKPTTEELLSGGKELIETWHTDDSTTVWVDLVDCDRSEENEILQGQFDVHELAVQDAQRNRHPPKLEFFDDYTFLLLRGLAGEVPQLNSEIVQIGSFVGARFVITRRSGDSPAVTQAWHQVRQNPSLLGQPARVMVTFSRALADRYFAVLLNLESRLDDLEEEIVHRPADRILEELIGYRTGLERHRRVFTYHVRAFDTLRARTPAYFGDDIYHLLNDVYEQFERGLTLVQLYYSLAADLIDGYISVASHRLNNIVKILTIVTTIFVPLSFLAGIYGMNFEHMPELKSHAGYFILLGVMLSIAAVLLYLFRRIRWL